MIKEMFATLLNIKHNGMTWTIRSEYLTPIMNEFVKKLDDVTVSDGVRIIKSNKARTTLSAPFVNGQRVIVKRYHSKGWLERIKYLFRPSRAKAEWDMMNALLDKGISTCVPLAYGERRRWGFLLDGSLIVKEIPDCLSFQAYIRRHYSGVLSKDKILQKRELLRKLAGFVRHIHDKDIDHRDFHGGNILVTETDSGNPVFYLIDLHKARVCNRLSLRRKINNLALQCDIPGFPFSRTDCLRLIKYYNNLHDKEDFKSFALKTLKRIEILKNKRLKSTTRWCLKLSNVFSVYKAKGVRIYYRKEYKLADILDLFKRVEDNPELEHGQTSLSMPPNYNVQCHVLKRSSKSVVFLEEIPFREIPKKVVVKYNFCRGFFDMLKKTFLGTRCRKAWIAANGLIVRGIPTPQPIALIEKKSFGFTMDNLLLTEYVDGLLSVNDYISKYFNNKLNKKKRLFTEELARLVRLFHDTGIYHGDLSGRNILVKERQRKNWEMFITDLDAASLWKKLTLKRQLKNLSQINDCPDCITNADRMRFFKTYFRRLPPEAHEYIREIVKLTAVRRQRRKRSNTDKQVCPCHPA